MPSGHFDGVYSRETSGRKYCYAVTFTALGPLVEWQALVHCNGAKCTVHGEMPQAAALPDFERAVRAAVESWIESGTADPL